MNVTMTHPNSETVVLRSGLSVPLPALQLLWSLEDRGFTLREGDGWLLVAPRSRLTPADDAAIRRHRDELLALVAYCETVQ